MLKGESVAGTDTRHGALGEGLGAALRIADNDSGELEDAVRLFRVAMHDITRVAVFWGKKGGSLVRVGVSPEER